MIARFATNRFFLVCTFLILASSIIPLNKLLAGQTFSLSKNSGFSTEDRVFTRQDTLYMKIVAPDIDFTDIEENEWRLKPKNGGNDFESGFKNHLDGTYTAKLGLSAADISESEWALRVTVADDSDNKFETRVGLKITGGENSEDDFFKIKSKIDSLGSDFLIVQSTIIFVNAQTQILNNDNSNISFTDLKIGDSVQIKTNRNAEGNLVASRIKLEDNGFVGDEVELKGKIDNLADSSLVVLGKTFYVDSYTEILDDENNPVMFSDLTTEQTVEVKGLWQDNKLIAKYIKLGDEDDDEVEVAGTIDAVDSDNISVNGIVFAITPDTEILNENDNPISTIDLTVGMRVEIQGVPDGSTLTATRIQTEDSGFDDDDDDDEITASVIAVGENSLSTTEFTFNVDEFTVILDDRNQPISLSDVKVGFVVEVRAKILPDGSRLAIKIKVEDSFEDEVQLTGRIQSINDISLTVSDLLFTISDSTIILNDDDNAIDFSGLLVGDLIKIRAEILINGTLLATQIKLDDDDDDEVELVGAIEELNSDNLVVSGIQFFVDANTVILDNEKNPITFNQLTVGQIIKIKGNLLFSGQLVATEMKLENRIEDEVEITGQIETLTNDAVTIIGLVFNITENTVIFDDDNNLVAFSKLSVGKLVEVLGDLLADGTLVAIRIKIENGDNYEIVIKGAIEALAINTLNVLGVSFQVTETTEVLDGDSNTIAFDNLMIGQTVKVKANRLADGSNVAVRIKIEDVLLLSGSIKQVVSNGVSVADTPIIFDANTVILGKFNRVIGLEELSAGQFVEVRALQINNTDIFATKVKVQGTNLVTSISSLERNGLETPSGFALNQNYPNPFNPTTTIAFSIQGQAATNVQLTVYNLLGQAVRVLIVEPLNVGSYKVQWNGRDGNGNPSASGVYIYRLKVGNEIQSRQMLLLK